MKTEDIIECIKTGDEAQSNKRQKRTNVEELR